MAVRIAAGARLQDGKRPPWADADSVAMEILAAEPVQRARFASADTLSPARRAPGTEIAFVAALLVRGCAKRGPARSSSAVSPCAPIKQEAPVPLAPHA